MSLNAFLDNDWGQTNQDFGSDQTDQVIDSALKNLTTTMQAYNTNAVNVLNTLKGNLVAEDESLESQIIMAFAKQEMAEQQQTNKILTELSKYNFPTINKIADEIETTSRKNSEVATQTKNEILKQIQDSKLETDTDINDNIKFIETSYIETFGLLTNVLFGLKQETRNTITNYLVQKMNEFTQAQRVPWEDPVSTIFLDVPGMENVFGPWKDALFDYVGSKTDFYTQQFDFVNELIKAINNIAKSTVEQNEISAIIGNDGISTKKKTLATKIKKSSSSLTLANNNNSSSIESGKNEIRIEKAELENLYNEIAGVAIGAVGSSPMSRTPSVPAQVGDVIAGKQGILGYGRTAWTLTEVKSREIFAGLESGWVNLKVFNELMEEFKMIFGEKYGDEISSGRYISREVIEKVWLESSAPGVVAELFGGSAIATFGSIVAATIFIYAGIELNIGQYAVELQNIYNKTDEELKQEADNYTKEVENLVEDADEDFKTEGAKVLNLIAGITIGFEKDIRQAITDYITQEINKFKPKGPGDSGEKGAYDYSGSIPSLIESITSFGGLF